MKDYRYIEAYLNDLKEDIYSQPNDKMHFNQTRALVYTWLVQMRAEVENVLDIGCGDGFAFKFFNELGWNYKGIAIGEDVKAARKKSIDVVEMDMHFLDYGDCVFDLLFARHVLEHSPMPLIALMEWYRVARKFLVVVVPHHENVVQGGVNHYYMLNPIQWRVLFKRARWELLKEDYSDPSEHRFLLRKK